MFWNFYVEEECINFRFQPDFFTSSFTFAAPMFAHSLIRRVAMQQEEHHRYAGIFITAKRSESSNPFLLANTDTENVLPTWASKIYLWG